MEKAIEFKKGVAKGCKLNIQAVYKIKTLAMTVVDRIISLFNPIFPVPDDNGSKKIKPAFQPSPPHHFTWVKIVISFYMLSWIIWSFKCAGELQAAK